MCISSRISQAIEHFGDFFLTPVLLIFDVFLLKFSHVFLMFFQKLRTRSGAQRSSSKAWQVAIDGRKKRKLDFPTVCDGQIVASEVCSVLCVQGGKEHTRQGPREKGARPGQKRAVRARHKGATN